MQNHRIHVLQSLIKSGTDDYFSFNLILVQIAYRIEVCGMHELGRILTAEDI